MPDIHFSRVDDHVTTLFKPLKEHYEAAEKKAYGNKTGDTKPSYQNAPTIPLIHGWKMPI